MEWILLRLLRYKASFMNNIEERAKEFADNYFADGDATIMSDLIHIAAKNAYWHGAIDQHKIDRNKLKSILNQLMIDTKDKAEIIKMMES